MTKVMFCLDTYHYPSFRLQLLLIKRINFFDAGEKGNHSPKIYTL
jgi:hypothetical protein